MKAGRYAVLYRIVTLFGLPQAMTEPLAFNKGLQPTCDNSLYDRIHAKYR